MAYLSPWRGDEYDAWRLLVLGESAYNITDPSKPVPPSDSIHGLINQLNGKDPVQKWQLHFERIFRTVQGAEPKWNAETAQAFFQKIAYTNYIQESVGSNSRFRPSRQQWASARVPFRELLSALKPKGVLILGFGVWGDIIKDFKIPKAEYETFGFPCKNGNCDRAEICVIPHPASWNRENFNNKKAHEHFRKKLLVEIS